MSVKLPYKYRAYCDCGRKIVVTIPTNPQSISGERVRCADCNSTNWAECRGVFEDER